MGAGKIDRRKFIQAGAAAAGAAAVLDMGSAIAKEASGPATAQPAPTIYLNGTILTMERDAPDYVEAVAVKDGKIVHAGSKAHALAKLPGATQVDLQGRTMLPGFIDSWGHFTLFAQQTLGVNLAYFADDPPRTKADIIRLLRATAPFNGWITGYGYSEALLSDGPPTLADLDAAFLATLTPGGYTVQVSGLGNTTGVALVEVYEIGRAHV